LHLVLGQDQNSVSDSSLFSETFRVLTSCLRYLTVTNQSWVAVGPSLGAEGAASGSMVTLTSFSVGMRTSHSAFGLRHYKQAGQHLGLVSFDKVF